MARGHAMAAAVLAALAAVFAVREAVAGPSDEAPSPPASPAPAPAPETPGGHASLEGAVGGALEAVRDEARDGQIGRRLTAKTAVPAQDPAFRIVSWNVQTFGRGMKKKRRAAYKDLLDKTFRDNRSVRVIAVQEVASLEMAEAIDDMLPGPDIAWDVGGGRDSNDAQDNFFYAREDVVVECDRLLFTGSGMRGKSKHPARLARMRVGDFDFTIITLHLTYGRGSADGSKRELGHVLEWLRAHLKARDADPDVIIAGDFNLPTRAGKEQSQRRGERGWHVLEDIFAEYPEFAPEPAEGGARRPKATELHPLVDEPSSRRTRSRGEPANNYDHFILTGDLYNEEYVDKSARLVPKELVQGIEQEHGVFLSDHFPIVASFRMGGEGADGRPIKPDGGSAACAP